MCDKRISQQELHRTTLWEVAYSPIQSNALQKAVVCHDSLERVSVLTKIFFTFPQVFDQNMILRTRHILNIIIIIIIIAIILFIIVKT